MQVIRVREIQAKQACAGLEPGEVPRRVSGRAFGHAQCFEQPVSEQQAAIGRVDPRRLGRDQRAVQPDDRSAIAGR